MKIFPSATTNTPTAPPLPQSDMREILRLSLDGFLPPGGGIAHWFDRLEARR
jgi:hypothetical protein